MIVKNSKLFTMEEEEFNRTLNDFRIKLENLKETDLNYYTMVTASWIKDINELLEKVTRDSNLTTRLQRMLELFEN